MQQGALYLGLALLCPQKKDGAPCLTCDECLRVISGNSLHFRRFEETGKWGVDRIRDVQEFVQYGSDRPGSRLIVVLGQADVFTVDAANAFLKTLEEPPQGVTFILLTYRPLAILDTIRSRCQSLDFPVGDCEGYLASLPEAQRANYLELTSGKQELLRYALDFGFTLPVPYRSLADVLALDLDGRMAYAQALAGDKESFVLILSVWMRESMALGGIQTQVQELLIATASDMKYNVNLRLHTERLLVCLP